MLNSSANQPLYTDRNLSQDATDRRRPCPHRVASGESGSSGLLWLLAWAVERPRSWTAQECWRGSCVYYTRTTTGEQTRGRAAEGAAHCAGHHDHIYVPDLQRAGPKEMGQSEIPTSRSFALGESFEYNQVASVGARWHGFPSHRQRFASATSLTSTPPRYH